jgi:hypothetical protein
MTKLSHRDQGSIRCDHLERIADLRKEFESVLDQRNQALGAKARSEDKLPIKDKK